MSCGASEEMAVFASVTSTTVTATDALVGTFLPWACAVAQVSGLLAVWLLAGSCTTFPDEPPG